MYSANRFPVMLYEGGAVGYAEGGLHDEAMAVRKAGRNGDSRLVHVNDDEFAEMVAEYGEPTINPETGMPEFFLGKLGKILKKVAPIALNFIPGVGPLASAAVGAALGATGGGGLKGALLGGAMGGLGAGGAGGIGAKLGTGLLGQAADPRLAQAIGSGLLGAGASAALGGDPLMGGLGVGLGNYLRNPMAKVTPGAPTVTTAAPTDVAQIPTAAPASMSTPSLSVPNSITGATPVSAPMLVDSSLKLSPALQASIDSAAKGATTAGAKTAAAAPNFWNKDFLGLGIAKNKYALPAIVGAAALADAMKPKGPKEPTQEEFFGPTFNAKSPGSFRLASLSPQVAPTPEEEDEYYKTMSGYRGFAVGGDVGGKGRSGRSSFAVSGPGDGRSDDIPAMLSDGEYVIDAETVALLGNGSPKAGAKKLDDLRVKIRKHKGKKLAKGKFSHDAKSVDKYMAGGRI